MACHNEGTSRVKGAVYRNNAELLRDVLSANSMLGHEELAAGLRLAADLGHSECAELLLEHSSQPNIHDGSGFTPLILAAKGGHLNVLKLLIAAQCNLNKSTFRVRATALHWAATNGHHTCVQALIQAGCTVDSLTTYGRTPLMLAARSDESDIVAALLKAGANPNAVDVDNKTALHLAAEEGSIDCVKTLLDVNATYNVHTKTGDTPLLLAAKQGHLPVLEVLMQCNSIELASFSHGLSIVHWAAYGGHDECLSRLLDAHSSDCRLALNTQTRETYFGPQMVINAGVTPLMLACSAGHKPAVEILLRHKVELELVDYEGMTALLYAIRNDHSACVYSLLFKGADPNHVNLPHIEPRPDSDYDDFTFDTEEAQMRLEMDTDEGTISPLFYAIDKDCRTSFLALLRANCSIHRYYTGPNNEHLQPLELSLCRGRYRLAMMLIRVGYITNLALTDTVQHALALLLHKDAPMFNTLMDQLSSPPSLLSQTRHCIRQCLGDHVLPDVNKLPLPPALIRYVNLSDLEDLIT